MAFTGDEAAIHFEIDRRVVPVAAFIRLADRCDDRLSLAACFGEIGLLEDLCTRRPWRRLYLNVHLADTMGDPTAATTGVDAALQTDDCVLQDAGSCRSLPQHHRPAGEGDGIR